MLKHRGRGWPSFPRKNRCGGLCGNQVQAPHAIASGWFPHGRWRRTALAHLVGAELVHERVVKRQVRAVRLCASTAERSALHAIEQTRDFDSRSGGHVDCASTTWRASTMVSRSAARRRRRGRRRRAALPTRAACWVLSATGRGALIDYSRGCGPPRRATATRRGAGSSTSSGTVGLRLSNNVVGKPWAFFQGFVGASVCKTLKQRRRQIS